MGAHALLFLPATRLDRLSRALGSGARKVVVDLEDGVGAADKDTARSEVLKAAADGGERWSRRVLLRINAPHDAEGSADLDLVANFDTLPAGLMIPKVESLEVVREVASRFARTGRKELDLHALIESARGILNLAMLGNSRGLLASLSFGSADYCAETGAGDSSEGLLWARSAIVAAAAGAGVPAYDSVCLQFGDDDALRAQCAHARELGFAGKLAIHPDQVAVIDREMSASPETLDWARSVVEASERAGGGVAVVEGQMVDAPVVIRARRILEAENE